MDEDRVLLRFSLPWSEVVTDFHDKAKNISSGYASFHYKEIPPQQADLVKCEMTINEEVVDALSFVAHRSKVQTQGRQLAERLKKVSLLSLFLITGTAMVSFCQPCLLSMWSGYICQVVACKALRIAL